MRENFESELDKNTSEIDAELMKELKKITQARDEIAKLDNKNKQRIYLGINYASDVAEEVVITSYPSLYKKWQMLTYIFREDVFLAELMYSKAPNTFLGFLEDHAADIEYLKDRIGYANEEAMTSDEPQKAYDQLAPYKDMEEWTKKVKHFFEYIKISEKNK